LDQKSYSQDVTDTLLALHLRTDAADDAGAEQFVFLQLGGDVAQEFHSTVGSSSNGGGEVS
jgi:hypothetical protein